MIQKSKGSFDNGVHKSWHLSDFFIYPRHALTILISFSSPVSTDKGEKDLLFSAIQIREDGKKTAVRQ